MGDYNQSTTGHHALVFGASGILGWSIVDQILKHYPEKGVFSKVTALSNRPLSEDTAFWPKAGPGIPELRIVDGVDLSKGSVEDVQRILATRVPDIAEVTHIYYFGESTKKGLLTYGHKLFCGLKSCFPSVYVPQRLPNRVGAQSCHAQERVWCGGGPRAQLAICDLPNGNKGK